MCGVTSIGVDRAASSQPTTPAKALILAHKPSVSNRSVRRRSTAEAADGCHRPLPANVLKATVTRCADVRDCKPPNPEELAIEGGSSAGGTWLQNACNHTRTRIGQFHSPGATLRCDADWSPKVAKGLVIVVSPATLATLTCNGLTVLLARCRPTPGHKDGMATTQLNDHQRWRKSRKALT